jgi:hypothetical protein
MNLSQAIQSHQGGSRYQAGRILTLILYNRTGMPAVRINNDNRMFFGCHADELEFVDNATCRPVYDFITLNDWIQHAVVRKAFEGFI